MANEEISRLSCLSRSVRIDRHRVPAAEIIAPRHPWPAGVARPHIGRGPYLPEPVDLDEDRTPLNGVAGRVQLVPVEPDPPVVRGPVVDPDHPEEQWLDELDARRASYMEDVTGPG
jgi:hypothetical protein